MSIALLSPVHYHSSALALTNTITQSNFKLPSALKRIAKHCYQQKNAQLIEEEIARHFLNLYKLNAICYFRKYSDFHPNIDQAIKNEVVHFMNEGKSVSINHSGLLKALESIAYQIELHFLEDYRPLRKAEKEALIFLDEITKAVDDLPTIDLEKYDTAKWMIS